MKNKLFFGVVTGMFLSTLVISMYFVLISNMTLFMSSFVLCIFFFLITVSYISTGKNEIETFESTVNNIIKNNKNIMVKSINYPDLLHKNIIRVGSINDLLSAQEEIKKPIYYIKQVLTCSFILIDNEEALVFILKKSEDVVSALDIIIKDINTIKNQEKRRNNESDDLLSDLDRTTIVKMSDNKKYKVSPIRMKKKSKDVK